MGLERTIRFDNEPPSWEAIRERLSGIGEAVQLRMIDGLPAFPDETPESSWKELRVSVGGGMVTLRRGPQSLSCMVWGNADAGLAAGWSRVTWACASAGKGTVETEDGPLSAAQFAKAANLAAE